MYLIQYKIDDSWFNEVYDDFAQAKACAANMVVNQGVIVANIHKVNDVESASYVLRDGELRDMCDWKEV